MPSPSSRTPSYRLHKPTGQAVVTLDGLALTWRPRHPCERWKAYDRAVVEWLANGRKLVSIAPVTVADMTCAGLSA